MKKLLLHTCCGPCATPIIPNLNEKFEVAGFYYNPNIFPETEFKQRLSSAKKAAEINGIKLIVPEQDNGDFFKFINETRTKPERCILCYKQRLAKTAEYAKEHNFSFFSTTLLISPFQYHKELKKAGEEMSKNYGVDFYYHDFRPLYRKSREMAKELDLYLQKYCGCKFSRRRK
jgi:predicted adenine nucleotide alpha hydrolase (AANH) superfamily ATPase